MQSVYHYRNSCAMTTAELRFSKVAIAARPAINHFENQSLSPIIDRTMRSSCCRPAEFKYLGLGCLVLALVVFSSHKCWAIQNVPIPSTVQLQPAQSITSLRTGLSPDDAQLVSPNEAGTTADSDEVNQTSETVAPEIDQRVQMLLQIPLNRVPSQLFEAWRAQLGIAPDTSETLAADGLPPAPLESCLASNERFQLFLKEFQQDFALGYWDRLEKKILLLPKQYHVPVFDKLFMTLALPAGSDPETQARMQQQSQGVDPRVLENQAFVLGDVFEILQRYPQKPLPDSVLAQVGGICQAYIAKGFDKAGLSDQLKALMAEQTEPRWLSERQAAKILAAAQQLEMMGDFLPSVEQCKTDRDYEALNLHAAIALAVYEREKKSTQLENVWLLTQSVLAGEQVPTAQQDEALKRAVMLAGKVRAELGQAWLQQSFGEQFKKGLTILATVAQDASQSMLAKALDPTSRLDKLKLQNDAVSALIKFNPEIAEENSLFLAWIADNWLRESRITYTDDESNALSPSMRRDMYGNMFYYNPYDDQGYYQYRYGYRQVQPIKIGELLEIKPADQWLDLLPTDFRAQLEISLAKLYLKVEEDDLCFPYIERIAKSNREAAKGLVHEYLRVWTKNHDPNAESQRRNNYYMYMYGFESRAESIPLTRSKQQRNLKELSQLIPRLSALNVGDIDQELITNAFLTCHSFAEVYRIGDIESILGPLLKIKPQTISTLAQRMRSNLAGVWREMETQKQAKTKRNKADLEAEVLQGYQLASEVVDKSLTHHPGDWSLLLVQATLKHDENNYRSDLKNRADYSANRKLAFDLFQRAAQAYVAKVPELEEQEYRTDAFEHWMYAALGASDLGLITEKHQTELSQPPLIRAAMEQLPPEAAAWHMQRFANLLFDRTSAVQPHSKYRYLKAGFEIVGDHPHARQAKAVFEYYQDLVTEIQLEMLVDGTSQVGTKPFGVFVNLRHTKEIERESGGFGKYLQNQNQGRSFYYNYGRPLEDYRDKFEEYVRQVMNENFEVLSVTFQVPEVKSRPTADSGWRTTPYAYLLLKSRGAQVDKVPPVKVDFDFLDTTGYSILPVESPALAIASGGEPAPRPARDVQVTQILDERQQDEGKLVIEIKAVANGLVPEYDHLFGSWKPETFEISVEDQGVSVARFNPDAEDNVVSSERTWLVTLTAKPGTNEAPQQFSFPQPDYPVNEVVYQRYRDADLEPVTHIVALAGKYIEPDYTRFWWSAAGIGLCAFGMISLAIAWSLGRSTKPKHVTEYPEQWTPFAALAVMERLRDEAILDAKQQQKLADDIQQLEVYYFRNQRTAGAPPDVDRLVQPWLRYAR